MWGVYDKITQEFSFDGSCAYRVQQLSAMVKRWKSLDFTYISNSVHNRIDERINYYLQEPGRISDSQYIKYKYLLAYFRREIPLDIVQKRLGSNILGEFDQEVIDHFKISENNPEFLAYQEDYIKIIKELVTKYERTINRTDVNTQLIQNVQYQLGDIIRRIAIRFYEAIKTGKYFRGAHLPCPDIQECEMQYNPQCGLYYYGVEPNYLNELDQRLLLA
jgi:hypothetical protein